MEPKSSNAFLIIGGIIILSALGLGAYAFTKNSEPISPEEATMNKEKGMMEDTMEKETSMEEKDGMIKEEAAMNNDSTEEKDAMTKAGRYEAYAPEKLARAETGDVVLFFHAAWCPSCRGLSADIEENKAAIPADLSILKVDYDTETELKKKYGVTSQHTLVQVAADGTRIKKWSGSPTLVSVVTQVN